MNKKTGKIAGLLLLLCAAVLALSGCSQGTEEEPEPGVTQLDALTVPSAQPTVNLEDLLPEGYDPSSEEDGDVLSGGILTSYAGATPVPLDPLDKPTATPRPQLTFSYVKTVSQDLGLTFEIPGNWTVDDSQSGTVVYTDPAEYDNVHATVTLRKVNVASSYKTDDLKTEIRAELGILGQYNFTDWSTQEITARKLMGYDGFYADYRGVMSDGTIVRGRVQMALMDNNQVLTLEYQAPGWYNSNYKTVFDHVRETLEKAE